MKRPFNKIEISFIPHKKQNYNTLGDYGLKGKTLWIKVSDMGNWRYENAIAVHEYIEILKLANKHPDLKQIIKKIDDFDIAFEKARGKGCLDEPGDEPDAPYYEEHQVATDFEYQLIHELDESWEEYDTICRNF